MTKHVEVSLMDSFTKCLEKNFDNKRRRQIEERIESFLKAEQEFVASGGKDIQKMSTFGKTLGKMGQKDVYSLELGTDRFLAKIMEVNNTKYYVFYWAGSHEKYNKYIKNLESNKITEQEAKVKIASQSVDRVLKTFREPSPPDPNSSPNNKKLRH